MERTIIIESLNEGKKFEVPKRQVGHTKYVLEKTQDTHQKLYGYETGYHAAYIVLKEIFPKLKYEDVDEMNDAELTKLNDIIWADVPKPETTCPKCGHKFTANFPNLPSP